MPEGFNIIPDPLPQAPGGFNIIPDPLPAAPAKVPDLALSGVVTAPMPSLGAEVVGEKILPAALDQPLPNEPAAGLSTIFPAAAPPIGLDPYAANFNAGAFKAASAPPVVPPAAPFQGPPQPLDYSDPTTAAAGFTPAEPPGTLSYGPLNALGAGATAAGSELGQTARGEAFTLQPGAQPEPQRGFGENVAYGIGHSWPTLATGAAGMAAGTAVGGPIGGVLGGAGGLALASLAQDLAPAYQAVRLAHPEMSHEDAVNYTWKHAAVAGTAGGLSGLILPYAPSFMRDAVGRILFQTFVAQPAVGAAARTATPLVTGEPLPDTDAYLSGYAQDVATGLALSGTHAAVKGISEFRPRRDEILPPLPSERPQLEGPPRGLPQGPPTIDMEPAGPRPAGPEPTPQPAAQAEPLTIEQVEPSAAQAEPARQPLAVQAEPTPAAQPAAENLPTPAVPQPAGQETATTPAAPTPLPVPPQQPAAPSPSPIPPTPVPPDDGSHATPPAAGEPVPSPAPAAGEAGPPGVVQPAAPERAGGEGVAPGGTPGDQGTEPAAAPEVTPAAPAARASTDYLKLDPNIPAEEYARRLSELRDNKPRPINKLWRNPDTAPPDKLAAAREAIKAWDREYRTVARVHKLALERDNAAYRAGQEPAAAPATSAAPARSTIEINNELTALNRQKSTLTGQITRATNAGREPSPDIVARREDLITRIAALEKEFGERIRAGRAAPTAEPAPTAPTTPAAPVEGLTTEPDHVVPNQHVAKDTQGEVVGKGPTPEAALADARGETVPGPAIHLGTSDAELNQHYPRVGDIVDGRVVRPDVPNTASIDASVPNSEELPGIREVPMSYFPDMKSARDWFTTKDDLDRVHALAEQIRQSGEVSPLIVVHDAEGPYILEGAHRAAALTELGAKSFPALVVLDLDSLPEPVVPGPAEAAEVPAEPAQPKPSPQLEALYKTRDELMRPGRVLTPTESRKLGNVHRQIAAAERAQGITKPATTEDQAGTVEAAKGGPRRGGRVEPFTGPPRVGRPQDFLDYKFNDGTSVFPSIFEDAGYGPEATSLPIKKQTEILSGIMKTKFGFTDVQVVGTRGKPATDTEHKVARDALLDQIRAMTDMTSSLGLPHAAASDYGNLRLEIVPEGATNFYGQYEHSGVIRVAGGANSFGHEWIHAIDHLLAERFTGNPRTMNDLLTRYGRNSGLDTSDNVQAAVAKLINTMFYQDAALAARRLSLEVDAAKVDKNGNPTKQALAAQDQLELLQGAGSKLRIDSSEFRKQSALFQPSKASYWASVYEMLARSGESYIARVMRQNGVDPRGVVMPDEAYSNMIERQLRMAYPKEDEQTAIFAAWDEVFAAMRNEQILDKGQPAGALGNYGISDPNRWKVSAPRAGRTSLGKTIRTEINRVRNLTKKDLLDKIGLAEENRPGAINRWPTRTMDGFRTFLVSNGGMQRIIIARAPPEAQKILQSIHDSLTSKPGSGDYFPENFEEKVRDRTRGWTHQYGNMLINAGFDPSFNQMTAEEGQMLRHILVTGETTYPPDPEHPTVGRIPIPASIVALNRDVRQLLDRIWKASDRAGLDIGYAKSGFFPRMYDRYKAAWEPAKFKTAAGRLYGKMFDDEIGVPGDDPAALLEKWTSLPRETRGLSPSNSLGPNMTELGKNLRRQRAIEENPNPTPAEITELQTLKGEAQQLAIDAHDALKDLIATTNADNWHANLVGGELNDFTTGVPTGKYLNARVLPPEADIIMRDFMYSDPNVAIPAYFHSVARRTARAELFGAKDEVLTDAVQKLGRIEGMDGNDTTKFFTLVNDVMGRTNLGGWKLFLQTPHNAILNAANLVLMDRAVWASFSEPVAAGMVTGDVRAGFRNMFYTIQQLAGTASAQDRTALAEFLNINSSAMHDSVMLSRMGSDVSDSIRSDKLLSNFYRTTFLTQVTNGQRAATVGTANWFIDKLSQLYLDQSPGKRAEHGRTDAARWFRELGLPDEIHKDFAQWKVDQQGQLPTPEMLAGTRPAGTNLPAGTPSLNPGMADAYSLAMRRLTDRIIQDPHKVDRSILSGFPLLGLGYQLMSFAYSFQKNVINPVVAALEHNFGRAKAEAQKAGSGRIGANLKGVLGTIPALTHAALSAVAMIMAAMLGSVIRQNLFARDEVEKHRKAGDLYDYYVGLAISRSGLTGAVDPVLQAFQSLKYNSSLAAMLQGAGLTWFAKNVQAALQPVAGEGNKNTNTAKYNQAKAVWNLLGVLPAALGLTALGSNLGPIGRGLSGAAMQYVTSPAMAERVATAAAGPKGAERPEEGGMPKLPEMSTGLPKLPKIGEKPPAAKSGGMSSLSGLVPWLDDIAIPAMRYIGPLVGGLSTPVKVGLGGAAAAYGVYDFLKETAPYRGQPAPAPKGNK